MSRRWIDRVSQTLFIVLALLLASPTHAQTCTFPDVQSGGIWTYFKGGEFFTITLVNLTGYLLYNSGEVQAIQWAVDYQEPFGGVPISVMDLDGDGTNEQGVPPYSGVTWSSAEAEAPTPQHYEGELILELKGFTDSQGVNHPAPTWANKFRVFFTPQKPAGVRLGEGTWIALRPDVYSDWDGRNLFRSGVWTTPHFPGNVSYPSQGDDLEMRNIMTMANRHVVVTLYSADNVNIVIVVRQTNWVGPAVPTDSDPVAGMDSYRAWQLDWVENDSGSVPRSGSCNQ